LKRVCTLRLLNDLEIDVQFIMSALNEFATIIPVRPNLEDRRIDAVHDGQKDPPSISVLDVGGKHQDSEDQTHHVDEQMSFPTRDLLAGIIATRAAHLGGLDRLAINDRGCRLGLAPRALSNSATQRIVDPFPRAILLPRSEIVIDQLPRW